MAKKKVLILGGGLSALSAGIHLLQEGGDAEFDVTIVCMEHRLGGKAASWRHPDDRYMEIGFHAVFGYYNQLQTLLARAGRPVTDDRYFTDNHGVHRMYEASARAVNELDVPAGPLDVGALFHNGFVGYEGMSLGEKLAAARWMLKTGADLLMDDVDPEIDEHSFTAYCVHSGLDVELTRKSWFRYVLDLAFNYPSMGSAYVGMYGFQRLMGPENSLVHYVNGPLSEVIVEPIAQLYASLGGKIELCTKATRVELEPTSRRIEAVAFKRMAVPTPISGVVGHATPSPIGGSYALEDAPYPPPGDPPPPASEPESLRVRGTDFDEVIWTLPVDSTRKLLQTTPAFDEAVMNVEQLRSFWALRTVASLSLRVWFPEKVMPSDYDTVVMGTPQPAATIIDYTNRVHELRQSSWGSVVEFEGQEGLHGDLSDERIVRELLESFRELPFVQKNRVDPDAVIARTGGHQWDFRRNTADHVRYLLMEPGHWKHRPLQHERPYENLTFAGDWMRGTQPTASMEAAVRTGRVAADILRAQYGLSPAK